MTERVAWGAARTGVFAPRRLAGVDLARGLAVLGMFAAHLLTIEDFDGGRPETWIDVANGRSSILFAVLAGVSIALMTGGVTPLHGDRLRVARLRLTVRAGLLWVIGILLITTGVPVYVILPAYAILFFLALPLLTLTARPLWILAACAAVVLPWLQPLWNALPLWDGIVGADLALLVGWQYPFTLWIAFLLAGMAAGRSDLRRARTQVVLLTGGALLAVLGYGVDAVMSTRHPWSADGYLSAVLTADAHSGGLLEVIGSGGFACAVIGGCLLLCRTHAVWIVLPLRAVGTMPLTAYVGQLVGWAIAAALVLGDTGDLGGFRALDPLAPFVITTVVFCTAWALLLGRGPLERLVDLLCRRLVPGAR